MEAGEERVGRFMQISVHFRGFRMQISEAQRVLAAANQSRAGRQRRGDPERPLHRREHRSRSALAHQLVRGSTSYSILAIIQPSLSLFYANSRL